jgi:protein TonB
MFESATTLRHESIRPGSVLLALGFHVLINAFVAWRSGLPSPIEADKNPTVVLYRAPPAKALPPPPAPRSNATRSTKARATPVKKVEPVMPKAVPQEPFQPAPAHEPVAAAPEVASAAAEGPGGPVGGVAGGTVGGVIGGVVGAELKPKNVPAFVVQRDMLRQSQPNLPEVFKQAHRGQALVGMYKVCVGTDGHVFEVAVIKSVPGADDAITSSVREGWLYKPQSVPVCFLYNMPITIQ